MSRCCWAGTGSSAQGQAGAAGAQGSSHLIPVPTAHLDGAAGALTRFVHWGAPPALQDGWKGKLMCSCQGASAAFLRNIPATLVLSQSSPASCFQSLFLPKERGLGLQDAATAPRDAGSPALCRGLCLSIPPSFWSTSAAVPWLEGVRGALCTSLPTLGSVIPHHTLVHWFVPELLYSLSGFAFQQTLTLMRINITDPPVTDLCVSTLGFLISACSYLDLPPQEDVHTLLFVWG